MRNDDYRMNPKSYAIELCEEGIITWETLCMMLLSSMSPDDVRWALDANEVSPRFFEESEYSEPEFDE